VAFLAVSALVICMPGPDTALTVRNVLAAGRRGGIYTAAGVATGQLVWTIAVSVGVAGVLAASAPAFLALKLIGAAYLIYLGVQSLRAAWNRGVDTPAAGSPRLSMTPARAFRSGLISNLANPKMAAFFLSLLPQFLPAQEGNIQGSLLLGAVFCLMTFAWLTAYSIVVDRARRLLSRQRIRRTLDAVTGGVLIAFGMRLALAQR
jgi:RhtB (resistance to homoserine/threonine) family protein